MTFFRILNFEFSILNGHPTAPSPFPGMSYEAEWQVREARKPPIPPVWGVGIEN